MEPQRAPLLKVNNVEVVYDHVILVLKGVSLTLRRGEKLAIAGETGGGKTTGYEKKAWISLNRAVICPDIPASPCRPPSP